MNDMSMMIQGNLALKYDEPLRTRKPVRTGFTVVEGFKPTATSRSQDARNAAVPSCARAGAPVSKTSIVLFATAVCVALAIIFTAFVARTNAYAGVVEQTPLETVRVNSGDTLWDLAEEHPVEGLSTYETVKLIKTQNGLSTSALSMGQSIQVPVSSNSR